MHEFAVPFVVEYVPTGQGVHDAEPATLNWPTVQRPVHADVGRFAVAPYDPALQFVHDADAFKLYWPAGQLLHADDPASLY